MTSYLNKNRKASVNFNMVDTSGKLRFWDVFLRNFLFTIRFFSFQPKLVGGFNPSEKY